MRYQSFAPSHCILCISAEVSSRLMLLERMRSQLLMISGTGAWAQSRDQNAASWGAISPPQIRQEPRAAKSQPAAAHIGCKATADRPSEPALRIRRERQHAVQIFRACASRSAKIWGQLLSLWEAWWERPRSARGQPFLASFYWDITESQARLWWATSSEYWVRHSQSCH